MHLREIKLKEHPVLGDLEIPFVNEETAEPYDVIVFVGENGCGKTTLLNELFHYSKSKYVKDKQESISIAGNGIFHALFVRQDPRYSEAMNELTAIISGEEAPYPSKSKEAAEENGNVGGLRSGSANDLVKGSDLVSLFEDESIVSLFQSEKLKDIKCSGRVLTVINGEQSSIDLNELSSGQQEIILKLKEIQSMTLGTDCVLLDEPEASLHPRWQKTIVTFIRDLIKDECGNSPQLFVATHSEKVLESLIGREGVLIVRLSKEGDQIKAERINEMDLALPKPTFAELDYVVFGIPSYDYHDQLYAYFDDLQSLNSPLKLDKHIRDSSLYGPEYFKPWTFVKTIKLKDGTTKQEEYRYVTIPSYIRNYFHHPKEGMEPTEDELLKSILFLRQLIKLHKNQL